MVVEINPEDVVSVPNDCDCQKLRTCKCKVVDHFKTKMPDTLCDEYYDEDEDYDPTVEDDAGDVDGDRGKTAVGGEGAAETPEIEDPDIRLVDHRWKIDKESPSLDIRSKKVEVLVDSEELLKMCGEGAVAITFPVKRGRVLHVLSHFGKQSSSDNEATIENILVNFLLQVRIRAGVLR